MKSRDIEKALLKKGFQKSKRDHNYFTFYHQGRKTNIFTMISHGKTDIGKRLISAMARQIRLDKNQFGYFVDCPLTLELYQQHLLSQGHIQISVSN